MRFVTKWVTVHHLSPFPSLINHINNQACSFFKPHFTPQQEKCELSWFTCMCLSRRQRGQSKTLPAFMPMLMSWDRPSVWGGGLYWIEDTMVMIWIIRWGTEFACKVLLNVEVCCWYWWCLMAQITYGHLPVLGEKAVQPWVKHGPALANFTLVSKALSSCSLPLGEKSASVALWMVS